MLGGLVEDAGGGGGSQDMAPVYGAGGRGLGGDQGNVEIEVVSDPWVMVHCRFW